MYVVSLHVGLSVSVTIIEVVSIFTVVDRIVLVFTSWTVVVDVVVLTVHDFEIMDVIVVDSVLVEVLLVGH